MKKTNELDIVLKTLLKIAWNLTPKFVKIAALIIFAEMTFIITTANPQDRFGLIVGFMFMLPFILVVLFMSIIEPNKKIKE
ncbi:hypothetical protein ES704_01042 [subsurface metagenome]|jgi:hypothetical protein